MPTMPHTSEHEEQVTLFQYIDAHTSHYPDLALAFAVPNGGYRTITTARRMKAEGARAGVPDLILPVSRRGYLSLAIELKVGRNRPSAYQQWWITQLQAAGWYATVCYGWAAAWDLLRDYLEGKVT